MIKLREVGRLLVLGVYVCVEEVWEEHVWRVCNAATQSLADEPKTMVQACWGNKRRHTQMIRSVFSEMRHDVTISSTKICSRLFMSNLKKRSCGHFEACTAMGRVIPNPLRSHISLRRHHASAKRPQACSQFLCSDLCKGGTSAGSNGGFRPTDAAEYYSQQLAQGHLRPFPSSPTNEGNNQAVVCHAGHNSGSRGCIPNGCCRTSVWWVALNGQRALPYLAADVFVFVNGKAP